MDQCLNVIVFSIARPRAKHWADETLSARVYRHAEIKKDRRWPMALINAIFFWQTDHCRQAYESEMKRTQLPPGMRE